MIEDPGDRAQRLIGEGLQLVAAVRDREGITEKLAAVDGGDKDALLVVLAALVDTDQSVARLLSWVVWDEFGNPIPPLRRPTGLPATSLAAHAAFNLARKLGHHVSDELRDAERAYQRDRKRLNREVA